MNYGPINKKLHSIIHGGDYNPEQWIGYDGIWDEDFRMMELAGCNAMTVGVFSWSMIEKKEGEFDFGWLDEIMDRLAKSGKYAVLATPSGARPAWLSQKYPEVLRTNQDRTKRLHGGRHNHCFTSPVYREKTRLMSEKLAERYKNHPALLLWHISNEFSGDCHCELCRNAFTDWLKDRYNNDLDKLNHAWWTTFWSHTYTDWKQIEPPSTEGEYESSALALEWRRFITHQTKQFMLNEMEPIRRITPDIPVTTNFMRMFKGFDYWDIASELDVASWDSYPFWHKGNDADEAMQIAFMHDAVRSMKGGKPFMLMESTPSTTNWQEVSKLKRPKMHMLSSVQAIAHGSDSVQYFQWRKSRGSFEKFHGAVVGHNGHENTRVFNDVAQLGAALKKLDEIVGTSVRPETAIIFDWENSWAIDEMKGINNSAKKYDETALSHYRPFWEMGIPADIINMDCSFDQYRLLIAPMLYMMKPGVAERIEKFVADGGIFVATYLSGIANETDLCFLGGFPGPLRKVLGIWCEETDGLYPDDRNYIEAEIEGMDSKKYQTADICDIIHAEAASVLARYTDDFYAGMPALTENKFGEGKAYYIAFRNNGEFERDFYKYITEKNTIQPIIAGEIPEGVSVATRHDDKNKFVFIMNFSEVDKTINLGDKEYTDVLAGEKVYGNISLEKYDLKILKCT